MNALYSHSSLTCIAQPRLDLCRVSEHADTQSDYALTSTRLPQLQAGLPAKTPSPAHFLPALWIGHEPPG